MKLSRADEGKEQSKSMVQEYFRSLKLSMTLTQKLQYVLLDQPTIKRVIFQLYLREDWW